MIEDWFINGIVLFINILLKLDAIMSQKKKKSYILLHLNKAVIAIAMHLNWG